MASYGFFDDANHEYVITNPKTPVKWINYIGSLSFGGFVDQTGGMLICRQDPALNRITRYLTQGPPSEFKGTTLYLRLPGDKGGYEVFSPFYVPTLTPLTRYTCHVGLGYSKIYFRVSGYSNRGVHLCAIECKPGDSTGDSEQPDREGSKM